MARKSATKKTKTTSSRFLRSVNLEVDGRSSDALSGYIATSGARRVLSRFIPDGTNSQPHGSAWTIVGPYGTGKSSFAVFLSQLLQKIGSAERKAAESCLRKADSRLAKRFNSSKYGTDALLPILVTGSREPINVAILRALSKAIEGSRRKASIALAKKVENLLLRTVEDPPGITNPELVDLIDALCKAECGNQQSGVILIVDELGKLLEYAADHPAQSDVYTLQHLAEHAVRSKFDFLLIGVLHQDFSAYANRLSVSERAEWQKVAGRFEDIVFEETPEDLLRLIADAREGHCDAKSIKPKSINKLIDQAWEFDLADFGLSRAEFRKTLLRTAPLHPMVAVIIGRLFRRLAQNERSVFSFLSSAEPASLTEFVLASTGDDDVYSVDLLYDYLAGSLGDGLFAHSHGKAWAEIAIALERIPNAPEHVVIVLKTIGVLNALGEWRGIAPTRDLIRFATSPLLTRRQCDIACKFLLDKSLIVSRGYNNSLVLWEGSDVDLDQRVQAGRDHIEGEARVASMLRSNHRIRPIVARRHAFVTGTLRFASCDFYSVKEAEELLAGEQGQPEASLVFVIPENAEDRAKAGKLVRSATAKKRSDILLAIVKESRALTNCATELSALRWVGDNTPELEGDKTARRELSARIAEVQRTLVDDIESLFESGGEDSCEWYRLGKKAHINSRRHLNEHISNVFDEIYYEAPIIRNELINRRQPSTAAAKARRELLERMIVHGDEERLGIEASPPELSLYLSVLMATELHRRKGQSWGFWSPSKADPNNIKPVWDMIQSYFDRSESGRLGVDGLIAELQKPPYGLRLGPIPILIAAALIASQADVALYEEGAFVTELSDAVLERFVKAPQTFEVRRWKVSGIRREVFKQLANMLGQDGPVKVVGKRDILDVAKPIFRFYASLPPFAKNTERVSIEAQKVREVMETAEEPDAVLFEDLPVACGLKAFSSRSKLDIKRVTEFLAKLKSCLSELQQAYDLLLEELAQAVANAFGLPSSGLAEMRSALSERAEIVKPYVSDRDLLNFVRRINDRTADDREWIAAVGSLLSEKPAKNWRDADRAKFEISLAQMARLFEHVMTLAHAIGPESRSGLALRLGVTAANEPEMEAVVQVPKQSMKKVDNLEKKIDSLVGKPRTKAERDIILATLARVSHQLMSTGQD